MAGKEEHKMFDYEEELDGYLEKIQVLIISLIIFIKHRLALFT